MTTLANVRFLQSGDTALVVEFGGSVDREVSARVLALGRRVTTAAIPGVVEVVPTFRSLMVYYDPLVIRNATLRQRIGPLLEGLAPSGGGGRHWRLPACYAEPVAADLADVARRSGLAPRQVIERHSAVTYHVYMVGFLPGFPYLGDLPSELHLPRRENPRTNVPPGSIAIATSLSCVYTLASPGGWHLLGTTAAPLWDPQRNPPALIAPGDTIVFAPVSLREHESLLVKAADGGYRLEPQQGPAR
jgi:KipI family sensor histidine kinase inhibitor